VEYKAPDEFKKYELYWLGTQSVQLVSVPT